jgi:hypothetical protein
VTVDKAARHLELSVDAVRKRVQRGQIAHEKDQAGRVRIILDESEALQDESPDTTGLAQSALLEAKDETIALLRQQLEAERQGHAEARRIIAGLVERIPPQIEPPSQELRESPTEGAEMPMGPTPSEAREEAQEPSGATVQPGRVEPQGSIEAADEAERAGRAPSHESAMGGGSLRRPWWRRMFGG